MLLRHHAGFPQYPEDPNVCKRPCIFGLKTALFFFGGKVNSKNTAETQEEPGSSDSMATVYDVICLILWPCRGFDFIATFCFFSSSLKAVLVAFFSSRRMRFSSLMACLRSFFSPAVSFCGLQQHTLINRHADHSIDLPAMNQRASTLSLLFKPFINP